MRIREVRRPGTLLQWVRFVVLTWFFVSVAGTAFPAQAEVVRIVGEQTPLTVHSRYLEDAGHALTMAQALASDASFQDATVDNLNMGPTQSVYWFRVPVENVSEWRHFVVELSAPPLDLVDFWVIDADESEHHRGGDLVSFDVRHRPHRTINFPLVLAPREEATLLFRIRTQSTMEFSARLLSEGAFGEYAARENMGLGLFYGIIVVMAVFNLFLFFSLRERQYIYYVGYLVFYLFWQMAINGTAFQYLFPNAPWVIDVGTIPAMFLAFGCAQLFTSQFLELPERLPKIGRFFRVLTGGALGAALVSLAVASTHVVSATWTLNLAVFWAVMTPVAVMLASGMSWRLGYQPARFFVTAWGVFMIGVVVYALKAQGLLPTNFWTEYSIQFGSALEVVLLTLALGDKLNHLQLERDAANQSALEGYHALELEVARREALEGAKDRLQEEIRVAGEQLIRADKLSGLGQLVAGVAHDIANPVWLIQLQSQMAREISLKTHTLVTQLIGEPDSEEARAVVQEFASYAKDTDRALDEVLLGAERINAINNAIRNQSRNDDAEKAQLLLPIVQECCTILDSKLVGIDVVLEIDPTLRLDCKRSQIGQVITNLMSNAADAVGEESRVGVEARVRLRAYVASGALVLDVADNGPGIPDAAKTQVLQAFYTTKAVGEGTGLGMSISHRIVEGHGGRLQILDCADLGGALIRVTLPVEQS